jgi:hypothetical protein
MPLAMLLMLVVKLNKFYFTRPIATFTFVQDDRFAKKTSCGSAAILLLTKKMNPA